MSTLYQTKTKAQKTQCNSITSFRASVLTAFWLLWTAMLVGTILIIVLNNGRVRSSTTTAIPKTTTNQ
uniref:SLC3A2_N domain-containing protein n=1 Tax=Angiostrongylus cantonensis TaxID=6313 RepID=A0A0K0DBN4_ANGCA